MPRVARPKKWNVFQPKWRSSEYEDPPEVRERQQFYLRRWKAQGKEINQPRIAWSLACARHWYSCQHRTTSEWGRQMHYLKLQKRRSRGGKASVARPEHAAQWAKCKPLGDQALRDRAARMRNPLAIPEKPKKVGRRLPL